MEEIKTPDECESLVAQVDYKNSAPCRRIWSPCPLPWFLQVGIRLSPSIYPKQPSIVQNAQGTLTQIIDIGIMLMNRKAV